MNRPVSTETCATWLIRLWVGWFENGEWYCYMSVPVCIDSRQEMEDQTCNPICLVTDLCQQAKIIGTTQTCEYLSISWGAVPDSSCALAAKTILAQFCHNIIRVEQRTVSGNRTSTSNVIVAIASVKIKKSCFKYHFNETHCVVNASRTFRAGTLDNGATLAYNIWAPLRPNFRTFQGRGVGLRRWWTTATNLQGIRWSTTRFQSMVDDWRILTSWTSSWSQQKQEAVGRKLSKKTYRTVGKAPINLKQC